MDHDLFLFLKIYKIWQGYTIFEIPDEMAKTFKRRSISTGWKYISPYQAEWSHARVAWRRDTQTIREQQTLAVIGFAGKKDLDTKIPNVPGELCSPPPLINKLLFLKNIIASPLTFQPNRILYQYTSIKTITPAIRVYLEQSLLILGVLTI